MFDGQWLDDARIGRGKMVFTNGHVYSGQFIKDAADGNGAMIYEDNQKNFIKFCQHHDANGYNLSGLFLNGKLTNKCEIDFNNGDKFVGMFKGGKPNGFGEMTYKNSIPSGRGPGAGFELAKYRGMFKAGKRDGRGSMYWADGSNFKGQWCNDQRKYGIMVMANGLVYEGDFMDDQYHS